MDHRGEFDRIFGDFWLIEVIAFDWVDRLGVLRILGNRPSIFTVIRASGIKDTIERILAKFICGEP